MGDDIVIALGLLPKGDAGVVGGHGHGFMAQKAVALHIGEGLGGEKVGGDQYIGGVLPQIGGQPLAHTPVGPVHRGFAAGRSQLAPRPVNGGKEPGGVLDQGHVTAPYQPGGALALQQHHIQHFGLMALPAGLLRDGLPGGVVPLPGVAG